MLNLGSEIKIKQYDYQTATGRSTQFERATVEEYATKEGNYSSLDVSLHDAKLDTLKTSTKTFKLSNGKRFKVKTITFERSDGVSHEIKIFGQHY